MLNRMALGWPCILGLLLYLFKSGLAVTIEWNGNNVLGAKKQGQSVVITCTGRGMSTMNVLDIRKQMGSSGAFAIVAQGPEVVQPFITLRDGNGDNRYTVFSEHTPETEVTQMQTLTLSINDLKGEDSGSYLCHCDTGEVTQAAELRVEVPITEVYLTQMLSNNSIVPVVDGATIDMMQLMPGGFGCHAKVAGAPTQPMLEVYIGDEVYTSSLKENRTEVIDTSRPYGLYVMDQLYSLERYSLNPDIRTHAKMLLCKGYTDAFSDVTKTVRASLNIEFGAELQYDYSSYWGEVGDTVTMTCSILANPSPDVFIKFGYNGDEEQHHFDEEEDDMYSYERWDDNGNTTVSFTIKGLTKAHYNYMYTIVASNKYNSNPKTVKFDLYEGVNPNDPSPSGATNIQAGLCLVFLLKLVALLV